MAASTRDYDDIPGTIVFDGRQARKGYALNSMCLSLNIPKNRAEFLADNEAYLDRYALTPEQRRAVLDRDWMRLLELGGNVYYVLRIARTDGLTPQHVGAAVNGITLEEFQQKILDGGMANG